MSEREALVLLLRIVKARLRLRRFQGLPASAFRERMIAREMRTIARLTAPKEAA